MEKEKKKKCSIRLSVVLAIYDAIVCASFIIIIVMFIVGNQSSTNRNTKNLVSTGMFSARQSFMTTVSRYENATKDTGITLDRLDVAARSMNSGEGLAAFLQTWKVLTIPMNSAAQILVIAEMWKNSSAQAGEWYGTGCSVFNNTCYFYNAATGETKSVPASIDSGEVPDIDNITTSNAVPLYYERFMTYLNEHPIPLKGVWSPLYTDFASGVSTHTCKGERVLKSVAFFYCLNYEPPIPGQDSPPECDHLVAMLAQGTYVGPMAANAFTPDSQLYLQATNQVDTTDGICNLTGRLATALDTYLKMCPPDREPGGGDCPEYLILKRPEVISVDGTTMDTGLNYYLVSSTPYDYFYKLVDQTKHASIAISAFMIALVVIVSIVMYFMITVPLRWVVKGLRKTSTLANEKELKPVSRYLLFTEVQQLYHTYVDLRKALMDLKAFVPQGLFVAPNAAVGENSLLSALMGDSGPAHDLTGDEASSDGEPGPSDEQYHDEWRGSNDVSHSRSKEEEELVRLGDGRPTYRAPVDVPVLQTGCGAAQMASTRFRSATSPTRDVAAPSPLSNAGTLRAGDSLQSGVGGIVMVMPVSTADAILADHQNQLAAKKGAEMAVMSSNGSPQRPHFVGSPNQSGSERARQRTNAIAMESGTMAGSTAQESLSLYLDPAQEAHTVNKFRRVSCSFLTLSFGFKYVDTESVEKDVQSLMDRTIRVILKFGGVIEILRPDSLAASFGAHATQSQHPQLATAAAITIMKRLKREQRQRTRLVVDTGMYYVGNCGAHDRVSRVVFGDRLDFSLQLMRYELGRGRLLATDRIAVCLPTDFLVPIDYVMPLKGGTAHGVQLFQVLNPARRREPDYKEGVSRFRLAFSTALNGNYAQALKVLQKGGLHDPEVAANFVTAINYLMNLNPQRPRYCRFQLPEFEPLGVSSREKTGRRQYERLTIGDIQPKGDQTVSINFGFGDNSGTLTGDANNVSRVFMPGNSVSGSGASPASNSEDRPLNSSWSGAPAISSHANPAAMKGSSRTSAALARRRSSAVPEDDTDRKPSIDDFAIKGCGGSDKGKGSALGDVCDEEGLPQYFKDHKGETWHRFPNPIGSGAFADVYKVVSSNGSLMAMKCIRLAASHIELADVVSEVNTACKLFNDYIVNHIGWAHLNGYLVIIMEYMPGGSLYNVLSAFSTGLTLPIVRRYAADSLRGLAYLHRNGIVHADLKPQNILLSTDGGCKISDFGSSVTKANVVDAGGDVFRLRGTALYMSPEVARGEAPSAKSDMWSFGITLYEMLTGRLPWKTAVEISGDDTTPSLVTLTTSANTTRSVSRDTEGDKEATTSQNNGKNMEQTVVFHDGGAAENGKSGTSTDGNPLSEAVAVPMEAPAEKKVAWVDAVGFSDVRFIRGVAQGTIKAMVDLKDLPSSVTFTLIASCLREEPESRPSAFDLIDHPFFILQ